MVEGSKNSSAAESPPVDGYDRNVKKRNTTGLSLAFIPPFSVVSDCTTLIENSNICQIKCLVLLSLPNKHSLRRFTQAESHFLNVCLLFLLPEAVFPNMCSVNKQNLRLLKAIKIDE